MSLLPVVSIIIPVYNAEKLLENCLLSLRKQTYGYLELVFVNDCSTDGTELVLQEFEKEILSQKHDYTIKLLHHEYNMGVATARNTGLDNATGEYVYYLDADDYLEDNAIEVLVNNSIVTGADIIGCNWILQFEKSGRVMRQPKVDMPADAIAFMCKGIMRWNLWLFLVRRSIYNQYNIRFLQGQNMGEDLLVMFKLLAYSKKISMVEAPLYHYSQSNIASLTKVYSDKHKEQVVANVCGLNDFFVQNPLLDNWEELLNYLKLNIKLPLLISDSILQYKEWKKWFPEANSYCMKNNLISKRIKILQFMADKEQYCFLKIHYYIVIKFVYGVIYK